jgi:hypothetical protein
VGCAYGVEQVAELSGRGRLGPGLPPARERDRGGQPAADGTQRVGPAQCRRDEPTCQGLLDRAAVPPLLRALRRRPGRGPAVSQLFQEGVSEDHKGREARRGMDAQRTAALVRIHPLRARVRLKDISDLVGHSSTSVPATVYRHEIWPALIKLRAPSA